MVTILILVNILIRAFIPSIYVFITLIDCSACRSVQGFVPHVPTYVRFYLSYHALLVI